MIGLNKPKGRGISKFPANFHKNPNIWQRIAAQPAEIFTGTITNTNLAYATTEGNFWVEGGRNSYHMIYDSKTIEYIVHQTV